MPRAQRLAPEPPEGYEGRWAAARTRAVRRCRLDPAVLTWTQALQCALDAAYPEAAPWTDPSLGEPWMADAATLVERSMMAEVAHTFDAQAAQGWQAMLWLRAEREIHDGNLITGAANTPDAVLTRIARSIYPSQIWPPGPDAPSWAPPFWESLSQIYRRTR